VASGGYVYGAACTLGLLRRTALGRAHFARKMYDSILNGPPAQLLIDTRWLVLMVMAGWCLFCAIALFLMLGQCAALYQYLNAFHF
jgi:hypothetical protein